MAHPERALFLYTEKKSQETLAMLTVPITKPRPHVLRFLMGSSSRITCLQRESKAPEQEELALGSYRPPKVSGSFSQAEQHAVVGRGLSQGRRLLAQSLCNDKPGAPVL